MTTLLTRRSVVAAAPTAVVAGASVMATGAAAMTMRTDTPDHELLQLAETFDRLHRDWQALELVTAQLEEPTDALIAAGSQTMDDLWRCRRETGYEQAATVLMQKLSDLDSVAERMREIPAQTLPGLVAKARLAQFDAHLSHLSDMQGPERDWDWEVVCMEKFVREIERFAAAHTTGGLNA